MANLDATTGTGNLGVVSTERHNKVCNLFNMATPGDDSDAAFIVDIMGVTRTIDVEGVYNDTNAEIKSFITTMEGYVNGAQTGHTFTSSIKTETLNVYIDGFTWEYTEGDTNKIKYTLTLIEGI